MMVGGESEYWCYGSTGFSINGSFSPECIGGCLQKTADVENGRQHEAVLVNVLLLSFLLKLHNTAICFFWRLRLE